jgi:carboxyl-terminal processing protease
LPDGGARAGEGEFFDEAVVREVRDLVLRNYVEEIEEFERKLYYGALRGMTQPLDPYSQFLTPDEREELSIDTSGKFGGLGIVIEKPLGKMGPIVVVTPFLGTPASKAGIRPGDRIVEIEGEPTVGMQLKQAVDMLRGRPGEPVRIKVQHGPGRLSDAINAGRVLQGSRLVSVDAKPVDGMRQSEIIEMLRAKRGEAVQVTVVPVVLDEPEELEIVRAEIHVPTVEFVRMADPDSKIGYVHLARFQEDSAEKLKSAIEELLGRGMRALVLDLRGNPGGLLAAAIEVSELFLPRGRVIVSTRARARRGEAPETRFRCRFNGPYGDKTALPLAVLVDGATASAGEIVSAAVRDNGRGILVGERTFGKGSVQKPYDVVLGRDPETGEELVGSLKLTVEKYYTPLGKSIQREPDPDAPGGTTGGIEPEPVVEMSQAEYIELRRQWERDKVMEQKGRAEPGGEGEGEPGRGGAGDERPPDPPLERAMEILRAVLVVTGGDE